MPWQTAPPLIIIAGAFNVAAGLMWGAQAITGEERSIQQDEWSFAMKNRDKCIAQYEDLLRKAAKSGN